MAGLRCGAFGVLPTVNECRTSPALGREWGVDETSAKSVGGKLIEMPCGQLTYNDTVINLYRHPSLLVSETVRAWVREYDYAGDNYSIVPYEERHPCAIEMKELYDSAILQFRSNK